jgi:hypothetical protein
MGTVTITFFGVTKFTALTPLSLLISCKLSFSIIGLRTPSLPTSVNLPTKYSHAAGID